MPHVALVHPTSPAPEPAFDPDQAAIVARLASGSLDSLLVVGGPGSGKTTLAVALAVDAVRSERCLPEQVLVLAPTRLGAAALRDRLSISLGAPTSEPIVRTPASVAWGILRMAATRAGRPAPVLISGAEQDQILKTLLAGHGGRLVAGPSWEDVVPERATALVGFRRELRDLFMRAEEAGRGPSDLRRLGETYRRPEWIAAAMVFEEYEANMGLRLTSSDQGERYDPAGIVSAAADSLAAWPSGFPRPAWPIIIVDDAQDITFGAWDMLRLLARDGARIVLLGNADESVQGYRGAVPHVIADAFLDPPVGLGAKLARLGGSHRQHPALDDIAGRVASRIGMAQDFSARRPPDGSVVDADASIEVIVSPHGAAEARALAARLREFHRGSGGAPVPWSAMAIVARTRSRAAEIRANLLNVGIPCASLGDGVALHRQPAVAALLALTRISLGESWTIDSARGVLESRVFGLDGSGLRRLKRLLIREERLSGGSLSGDTLLVDSLVSPSGLATIPGREAARAALAAASARDGASTALVPGATAGDVLWAIWRRLGVADAWREAAIGGSTVDDADLDAIVALFKAAQTHAERLPEAPPSAFLEYLEGQEFAADTLAAGGAKGDVVAFETPASAAGREWEIVAIAGLEEGVWPNLTLRDSVLGSAFLADVLAGRVPPESTHEADRDRTLRAARVAVLDDETRMFLVALTRARRHVIALSRSGVDDRPSRYIALLGGELRTIQASEAGGLSDLRDAVVTLRGEAANLESEQRAGHVKMLARLALKGVPGADPSTWYGAQEASSLEPLWHPDERVRVSPSRVEGIEECPLRAVLEASGGTADSGQAQRLGMLIHSVAAAFPEGPKEAILAAVSERWGELDLRDNWVGVGERERATEMVSRFVVYAQHAKEEGWQIATEVPFAVDLGRAHLSGRADRVHVREGQARIVDLKTGKTATSKKEAEGNPQLAMYQVAANNGGFAGVEESVGAELVYLGANGGPVRRQSASVASEGPARLEAIVETLSQPNFDAILGDYCRGCPVHRSCPTQPEGGSVIGT